MELKRLREERLWCPQGHRLEGEHMFARWPEGDLPLLPCWLVLRGCRGEVGGSGAWVGDIRSLLSQGLHSLLWSSLPGSGCERSLYFAPLC